MKFLSKKTSGSASPIERGSASRSPRLDTPLEKRRGPRLRSSSWLTIEDFGRFSERIARFMGTPTFLIYMTVIVTTWLVWNNNMHFGLGPIVDGKAQGLLIFDSPDTNYTLLTLILSLQASYAAPFILLAQNRQDDRDRVSLEQDRKRAERNLADTEFLTREIASLRLALREAVTRDYLRSELRDLLDEMDERADKRAWKRIAERPDAPIPHTAKAEQSEHTHE